MEKWQKLVLDPAHYAVLKNVEEPKKKDELAEEAGLKTSRCQKIIQNLQKHDLIKQEVENGVRKIQRTKIRDKLQELKDDIYAQTIGGTKEAVKEENYRKARKHLTHNLPVKGKARNLTAQLEAAEKLHSLT